MSRPSLLVFKQKTAYEMRISDWSSDVCSSDLVQDPRAALAVAVERRLPPILVPRRRHLPVVEIPGDPLRGPALGVLLEYPDDDLGQIGKESCRERVGKYG